MGYLVGKYGADDRLYPRDPEKRAIVDRMLYFDIGTLYRAMIDYFVSISLFNCFLLRLYFLPY